MIKRDNELAKEILNDFATRRANMGITTQSTNICSVGFNKKSNYRNNSITFYDKYKHKLEEENFDKFSTRDMMYYFKDIANENGVKYVVANPQIVMHQFKLCLERGYSKVDILSMIEFLFTSGQNYLSLNALHPGILLTNWCNTIYQDTQLWLKDEYDPKVKHNAKKKDKLVREWTQGTDKKEAKIGEWGGI